MKLSLSLAVLPIVSLVAGASAQAKTAAEIDQDHIMIQRLNREAAARYAVRDAGFQRERDESDARMADYARARAQYERDMSDWRSGATARPSGEDYAAARAQYDRDMADWRQRVADCRNGIWDACDGER